MDRALGLSANLFTRKKMSDPRAKELDESFRILRAPPVARLPFHQIGHPLRPLYLCPMEQVFQPPLLAIDIFSCFAIAFAEKRSLLDWASQVFEECTISIR